MIPATVGLKEINPKIKTAEWHIDIPTTLTPWPVGTTSTKRASVNSFGYGGANAHAILEDAKTNIPANYGSASHVQHALGLQGSIILPFSAATLESLDGRVKDFIDHDFQDESILDLAHTLASRRTHFAKRGYFLLRRDAAVNDALATQDLRTVSSVAGSGTMPYAFIFTGQGSQWPQMGRELFAEFPVFRDAVSELDSTLQLLPHSPTWTLREVILEKSSLIHHPTRSQPVCTAIQIALVRLLESWDILPSATLGHSSGEIAAAFSAGYLSSAAAITIAYYRGYVVGKHVSQGGMISAGLSEDEALQEIFEAGLQDRIQVACINSPESVTISGDESAIDAIFRNLERKSIFVRKLNTGGQAYHSHHMKALGQEYQSLLEQTLPYLDVSYQLPTGAMFVSSVTAEIHLSNVGPAYWRSNLEGQVLFSGAMGRLVEENDFHLIEIGPHASLQLPIKQTYAALGITEDKVLYSTALKRHTNSLESVLNLAGSLWLHGHDISFGKINGLQVGGKPDRQNYKVLHDLPPYRWHYDDAVLWNESRASVEFRQRKYPRHELLGSQIPGGNGFDIMWRNMLKIDDVPWLRDHALLETVVFPGAGYLCMAMQALLQATQVEAAERPTFRLENVNILTALALSTESSAHVELFTVVRRVPITYTSHSGDWWEFKITSFQDGISILHASGSISIQPPSEPMLSKYQAPAGSLELSAPKMWYEKLAKQGLNFGPAFRSIQEFHLSRMKSLFHCTTKLLLLRGDEWAPYTIHPITLDAMLQTAIVASTAGIVDDLKAKVPTRIGFAVIETPEIQNCPSASTVHSLAKSVGFGTAEIGAELIDSNSRVKVQLGNVRLAPYEVTNLLGDAEKRNPMLRVLWKPDVYGLGLIGSGPLSDYLTAFATESHGEIADEGLLKLGASLSLLTHKNPRLRILELGSDSNEITKATLDLLHSNTEFKRLYSYTIGSISEIGELHGATVSLEDGQRQEVSPITGQHYDLVILPHRSTADTYLESRFEVIRDVLEPSGILLALSSPASEALLGFHGLNVVISSLSDRTGQIVLAQAIVESEEQKAWNGNHFIVIDQGPTELSEAIARKLSEVTGQPVRRLAMDEITEGSIIPGATVYSLIESEEPVLSTSTPHQMHYIKSITDNASNIVWATKGNLLEGARPDFALVSGLARTLQLEQPSLKFFTFDIDDIEDSEVPETVNHLVSILKQPSGSLDMEFVQRKGVVHVSRFVPDESLNESFRYKQGTEIMEIPLLKAKPAELSIERVGQLDSIFFNQIEVDGTLEANEVQVQVKSIGINAKDFDVLTGKADTKNGTFSSECCGVVEKVGSTVSSVALGDRVVVMAPSQIQSLQIVPEWACQKLEDDEDFSILSTLPLVYATALYALQDRARLEAHETILIHSGTGGVGLAAIRIAKLTGAEIFTTVSTQAKKDYLVKTFDIDPAKVFNSRDLSFLPGILRATNGKGVDVVLNSLTGDLLHAGWRCCGMFGRFVEIGKNDLTTAGSLEMDQFLKSVTFTAFDLSDLYYSNPAKWSKLLAKVLRLYREKKINHIEPLKVYDISNISEGLRYFSSKERMGKVAINLENLSSVLRVRPFKYDTTFSSEKSYVMAGCLGGLGRSMSKWMMSRGARKFVFLGRSGLDKEPALRLVEDLSSNGAECKVVRGDVCNIEDVKRTVAQVDGLVGGVVQAAMGLNVSGWH